MLWPLSVHSGKRRTERRTGCCLILCSGHNRPPALFDRLELCLLTILSQYCSAMAAIHDATMRTMTIRSSSMSRPMGRSGPQHQRWPLRVIRPPRGPANPRITRKPASGGSGASRGSKILIGVVLALAIIVGLFFGLSRFITDLMWYGQLGFQSVVWTPARGENRSVGGLRAAHGPDRLRFRLAGHSSTP
mgnify:CR=1 FL=1